MRLTYLIPLLLLSLPIHARADTLNHVEAAGTFAGGTVSFSSSFDWNVTTQAYVSSSILFTSSGVMSGFQLTTMRPMLAGWTDPFGNHIQIDFAYHGYTGESFNLPGVYDAYWLELWCGSYRCLDGIAVGNDSGNNMWSARTGGITVTPIQTPEPPTILLTLAGLLSLAGIVWLLK